MPRAEEGNEEAKPAVAEKTYDHHSRIGWSVLNAKTCEHMQKFGEPSCIKLEEQIHKPTESETRQIVVGQPVLYQKAIESIFLDHTKTGFF